MLVVRERVISLSHNTDTESSGNLKPIGKQGTLLSPISNKVISKLCKVIVTVKSSGVYQRRIQGLAQCWGGEWIPNFEVTWGGAIWPPHLSRLLVMGRG